MTSRLEFDVILTALDSILLAFDSGRAAFNAMEIRAIHYYLSYKKWVKEMSTRSQMKNKYIKAFLQLSSKNRFAPKILR